MPRSRTRSRSRRTEQISPPGEDQISSVARTQAPSLDDLTRRYGADEVERAREYAERNDARHTLAYMATTLEDWHGGLQEQREREAPASSPHKLRLLCDICGLPSWIDDMVSRTGRAFCESCASKQAGVDWEEELRTPARQVHVLTQGDGRRAPTEADLQADPPEETLVEIARFEAMGPSGGLPVLLDWYLYTANAMYPKHQAALKAALMRLAGDEAEDALPEPPGLTEPTANAQAVETYWAAQATLDRLGEGA